MRAHELADGLRKLSAFLKKMPNVEIDELYQFITYVNEFTHGERGRSKNSASGFEYDPPQDLAANVLTLLSFSKVDKKQWWTLIRELGLDVEITSKTSTRDILNRVLRSLADSPDATKRLQMKVYSRSESGSPELARALSSLLGNTNVD